MRHIWGSSSCESSFADNIHVPETNAYGLAEQNPEEAYAAKNHSQSANDDYKLDTENNGPSGCDTCPGLLC